MHPKGLIRSLNVLYLMCDLAFAGKSTLAKAIARDRGCVYISLDDINQERGLGFGGDGIPVEQWEQTHHVALARLETAMCSGHCVVLDDTNNRRWLRDRFKRVAQRYGYETRIVYLDIPVDVIQQRMQRKHRLLGLERTNAMVVSKG